MADEAAMEEAPPETEKRRGGIIPIVAAGVLALVVGVGGTLAAVYFTTGFGGDAPAAGADEPAAAGASDLSTSALDPGVEVVPLESFKAKLNDGSGGRSISLDIALEGRSLDGKSQLSEGVRIKNAAIRDTVIFLLMDFTFAELRGTDGMLRLRDEIHRRIDVQLEDMGVRVDRVYFTDVHFN